MANDRRLHIFTMVLKEKTFEELRLLRQHGPEEDDLSITGLTRPQWYGVLDSVLKAKFNPSIHV